MTTVTVSRLTYASGAEVEVSKKELNSGVFVQLKINYEPLAEDKYTATDSIIVTLKPEYARELANAILKL